MLEELAVDYELAAVSDPKGDEYRAINPNGKVPCLRDGDITLWESMAINLYLAQTITCPLSPVNDHELADILKWTLWSQSELEEHFNHITSLDEITQDWMKQTFGVLEETLVTTNYLIGERFTVADLNVCAMFMGPISSILDLNDFPKTSAWRTKSYARDAAKKTIELMRSQ